MIIPEDKMQKIGEYDYSKGKHYKSRQSSKTFL